MTSDELVEEMGHRICEMRHLKNDEWVAYGPDDGELERGTTLKEALRKLKERQDKQDEKQYS